MAILNISGSNISVLGGTSVLSLAEDSSVSNITTSATSQQSPIILSNRAVRIAVTGGSVYLKVGLNPVASPTDSLLLTDGSTEYFSIPAGYRIAVINA